MKMKISISALIAGKHKKKSEVITTYSPDRFIPVIRCSICTGEQTAGFRDKATGSFHDIMLIRDERDLQEFRKIYGIRDEIRKEY